MKNLEKYSVKEISDNDKHNIAGGNFPWNPFWLAVYVVEEIYDGLTRPCDASCSHNECVHSV